MFSCLGRDNWLGRDNSVERDILLGDIWLGRLWETWLRKVSWGILLGWVLIRLLLL